MKHLSHYRRCPCRCSNKAASDTNQKRYLSQFVRVTLVSFHTIPPSVSLLFIFIHSFVSFFLSFFPFFASCRQFYICLRAPVSSCLKFLMLQHWLLELLASHQNSSCGLDRPTVIKRPSRCDSWARRTIKPAIKPWIRGNRIPRGVGSNFLFSTTQRRSCPPPLDGAWSWLGALGFDMMDWQVGLQEG